jgi:hypothetical protein
MSEPTNAQLAAKLNWLATYLADELGWVAGGKDALTTTDLRRAALRLEAKEDENANLDAACKMEHRENERLREALTMTDTMLEALAIQLLSWRKEPVVNVEGRREANRAILKSESPTLPEKES